MSGDLNRWADAARSAHASGTRTVTDGLDGGLRSSLGRRIWRWLFIAFVVVAVWLLLVPGWLQVMCALGSLSAAGWVWYRRLNSQE